MAWAYVRNQKEVERRKREIGDNDLDINKVYG